MDIQLTKRTDYPFAYGSTIYTYADGHIIPDYEGRVRVGNALFETWVSNGERNWACMDSEYFALFNGVNA